VFEDNRQVDSERDRLWLLISMTPALDWLLLTKRPQNIDDMVPTEWLRRWPVNVWAGTSVEHQNAANNRLPFLLNVPAAVRFLSCEPLLGPVDLSPWLHDVQWVIVGGESGQKSRPMGSDWVRFTRDQCKVRGVPFFFKQWGGRDKKAAGRELDGRTWDELPRQEV
jgi:protein gp37